MNDAHIKPYVPGEEGRWVADRELFVLLAKTFGCTVLRREVNQMDISPPPPPRTGRGRRVQEPVRMATIAYLPSIEETFRVRADGQVWMWTEIASIKGDRRWYVGPSIVSGTTYPVPVPPDPGAERTAALAQGQPFEEIAPMLLSGGRSMADQLALAGVTVTPEPSEAEAA